MPLEGMPANAIENRNYHQPGAEFPATLGSDFEYHYE
jgi:hypothetical protein